MEEELEKKLLSSHFTWKKLDFNDNKDDNDDDEEEETEGEQDK